MYKKQYGFEFGSPLYNGTQTWTHPNPDPIRLVNNHKHGGHCCSTHPANSPLRDGHNNITQEPINFNFHAAAVNLLNASFISKH